MPTYQRPVNIIPENDDERLNKLHSYEILDTPEENSFEKIAMLAAQIFNSPIAQVNFVDKDRVFLKSDNSPLGVREINREDSFCSLAILSDGVTVFPNMLEIPDLATHKYVEMENGVRFYAGAPLKTREGYHLGTVCVLDIKPNTPTSEQLKMLESLSGIVMDELELRIATRKAVRTQTDMVNRIIHDLKNPNTTIKLSSELIKLKSDNPVMVKDLAARITSASSSVLNNLNNLLDLSQMEEGKFDLQIHEVSVADTLLLVKKNFELVARAKDQKVTVISDPAIKVAADSNRLTEIFENLLSNALKYSLPKTEVFMTAKTEGNYVIIEVKDQGLGLNEDDMTRLFTKFARLSSVPTGKEHSNGLGLFIVKSMIELHSGKIWAESKGKNEGTSFFVKLPLFVEF